MSDPTPEPMAVKLDMTPERKERMIRISHEIIDILRDKTESPVEAMAVCDGVMKALEKTTGYQLQEVIHMREGKHDA